eukprot:Rmarinus@m.2952
MYSKRSFYGAAFAVVFAAIAVMMQAWLVVSIMVGTTGLGTYVILKSKKPVVPELASVEERTHKEADGSSSDGSVSSSGDMDVDDDAAVSLEPSPAGSRPTRVEAPVSPSPAVASVSPSHTDLPPMWLERLELPGRSLQRLFNQWSAQASQSPDAPTSLWGRSSGQAVEVWACIMGALSPRARVECSLVCRAAACAFWHPWSWRSLDVEIVEYDPFPRLRQIRSAYYALRLFGSSCRSVRIVVDFSVQPDSICVDCGLPLPSSVGVGRRDEIGAASIDILEAAMLEDVHACPGLYLNEWDAATCVVRKNAAPTAAAPAKHALRHDPEETCADEAYHAAAVFRGLLDTLASTVRAPNSALWVDSFVVHVGKEIAKLLYSAAPHRDAYSPGRSLASDCEVAMSTVLHAVFPPGPLPRNVGLHSLDLNNVFGLAGPVLSKLLPPYRPLAECASWRRLTSLSIRERHVGTSDSVPGLLINAQAAGAKLRSLVLLAPQRDFSDYDRKHWVEAVQAGWTKTLHTLVLTLEAPYRGHVSSAGDAEFVRFWAKVWAFRVLCDLRLAFNASWKPRDLTAFFLAHAKGSAIATSKHAAEAAAEACAMSRSDVSHTRVARLTPGNAIPVDPAVERRRAAGGRKQSARRNGIVTSLSFRRKLSTEVREGDVLDSVLYAVAGACARSLRHLSFDLTISPAKDALPRSTGLAGRVKPDLVNVRPSDGLSGGVKVKVRGCGRAGTRVPEKKNHQLFSLHGMRMLGADCRSLSAVHLRVRNLSEVSDDDDAAFDSFDGARTPDSTSRSQRVDSWPTPSSVRSVNTRHLSLLAGQTVGPVPPDFSLSQTPGLSSPKPKRYRATSTASGMPDSPTPSTHGSELSMPYSLASVPATECGGDRRANRRAPTLSVTSQALRAIAQLAETLGPRLRVLSLALNRLDRPGQRASLWLDSSLDPSAAPGAPSDDDKPRLWQGSGNATCTCLNGGSCVVHDDDRSSVGSRTDVASLSSLQSAPASYRSYQGPVWRRKNRVLSVGADVDPSAIGTADALTLFQRLLRLLARECSHLEVLSLGLPESAVALCCADLASLFVASQQSFQAQPQPLDSAMRAPLPRSVREDSEPGRGDSVTGRPRAESYTRRGAVRARHLPLVVAMDVHYATDDSLAAENLSSQRVACDVNAFLSGLVAFEEGSAEAPAFSLSDSCDARLTHNPSPFCILSPATTGELRLWNQRFAGVQNESICCAGGCSSDSFVVTAEGPAMCTLACGRFGLGSMRFSAALAYTQEDIGIAIAGVHHLH